MISYSHREMHPLRNLVAALLRVAKRLARAVLLAQVVVNPARHLTPVVLLTPAVLLAALDVTAAGFAPEPQSPLSAEQALEYFRLAPGLRIEIAACEPEVVDPVAVRFDEDGRMWVVEMGDYPSGPPSGQPPLSRIRVLEDRDADGRYESSTVFADKLLFATGLQPWRGGAIVTLAGRVLYLRDTNGDGRADVEETWFTGFAEENPQLRANHPYLAADQRVYIANGLRGGVVKNVRDPATPPLSISGLDFRFDPLSGAADAVSGAGQFGLTFDDWGNRFVCSNRNPLQQVVIENRYLQRSPQAAIAATLHDVATPGEASRIHPISRAWTTSNLHAGQFTAACGVLIFRSDGLTPDYQGQAFVCDPTGNLVHCERFEGNGTVFASRPLADGVEFLASPDEWFRPVGLQHGPDGALYVVDMYRAVIEHPEWVPVELQRRPDERHGDDRGRIYRIVAADRSYTPPPRLSTAGSSALVGRLSADDAWIRESAARLLVERQDASVHAVLAALVLADESPRASVHALWMLSRGNALDDEVLRRGLLSRHAGVRRQAAVVWEQDRRESLREVVRGLADHTDPQLRLQSLLSLAPIERMEADLVARVALADPGPWSERASLIAAGSHAAAVLQAVASRPNASSGKDSKAELSADAVARRRSLVGGLAAIAARDEQQAIEALSALVEIEPASDSAPTVIAMAGVARLAEELVKRRSSLGQLQRTLGPDRGARLTRLVDYARQAIRQEDAEEDLRIVALDLLSFDEAAADGIRTLALRAPATSVRLAAIRALERQPALDAWRELVAGLSRESPIVRRAILSGLFSQRPRTELLLEQLAAGRIRPGELDRAATDQLLNHPHEVIRTRSRQLIDAGVPADRQKVLGEYQTALELAPDSLRGREVFARHCATCHRVGGIGVDVAPDISDSRTKTPQQLLTDILQPNRAIDNNYVSYTIVDSEGRVTTGVLTAETATSVTLKQPEGKLVTLLRSQIEELRSNGVSLMPEGLEKNIPLQDMADVISFVKNWRYLDGRTPAQAAR